MKKENLGPTGEFPDGKINEDDRGEVHVLVRVGTIPLDGLVIIDFGTQLSWVELTPEQAEIVAAGLMDKAKEIRDYDKRSVDSRN